jgi:hypothetical protein
MNGDESRQKQLDGLKGALDASCERLDASTLARLKAGRLRALELAEARNSLFSRRPHWLTAGGLATTALLVVMVTGWLVASRQNRPAQQLEDLEIVAAQEQLDLYADLDFYRWLPADEVER